MPDPDPQPPIGSPFSRRTPGPEKPEDVAPLLSVETEVAPLPQSGCPPRAAVDFKLVSPETRQKLNTAAEHEHQQERDHTRGKIVRVIPELRMPRFLVRGGFLVGSVTFLSLVGLFVFAQTITLLAQIEVVPIAFRRIGYGLLAGLLAGIGTGAVRLLIAYFRLHRTQRITLRGIDELNARAQLRSLAAEETDQAYQIVRDYLDVFPTEEQTLTKIGFSPGQAEELLAACRDLKDPKKDLGPAQWLRRFRQKFQSIVDAAADACIKRHAMGVAVKFAAVPLPLVETAVVLHGALTMIADLCQIYRLRLGASSTVIVAGWAAIQGLLPGRVDEWTGKEAVSST